MSGLSTSTHTYSWVVRDIVCIGCFLRVTQVNRDHDYEEDVLVNIGTAPPGGAAGGGSGGSGASGGAHGTGTSNAAQPAPWSNRLLVLVAAPGWLRRPLPAPAATARARQLAEVRAHQLTPRRAR